MGPASSRPSRASPPRSVKRAETYFDRTKGAPSGFALRVTATGARTYYLIYRSSGSEKKSFLWVGDATRMSLADARDRAREADRLRGQGSDPVQERKREERTQRQRPDGGGSALRIRRGRGEPQEREDAG